MDEIDKIERVADKVLAPDRLVRWAVKLLLFVLVLATSLVVVRIALSVLGRMESAANAAALDHAWFVDKLEAIQAARQEEAIARDALERQRAEVDKLLFGPRQADRAQTAALELAILTANRAKLHAIKEYNSSAQLASDEVLGGLPRRVE